MLLDRLGGTGTLPLHGSSDSTHYPSFEGRNTARYWGFDRNCKKRGNDAQAVKRLADRAETFTRSVILNHERTNKPTYRNSYERQLPALLLLWRDSS